MPKPQNPGVDQGSQLVGIQSPFSGWAIPLSSVTSGASYTASIEGVEAAIGAPQKNQYASSSGVSLFQPERFGHIAPGQGYNAITDADSLITDLPLNGDSTSTGFDGIVVLNNGRVVSIDSSSQATVDHYDPTTPQVAVSSSTPNNDMIIFRDYDTSPTEWVVWSWEYSAGGGGANIAIAHASNFGAPTDNFYSSISGSSPLVKGNPHKICAGPDGNIYVIDGPIVQQIVLDAGLALSSVNAVWGLTLAIGSGWTATGICSYKNYIAVIASSRSTGNTLRGKTRVFLWDGTSTTNAGVTSVAPQFIFDIPDNFGNGIFFDGDTLFAFTNGRNFSSKIFVLTGKGFKKTFETPFISPSLNAIQGGVENYQDGLLIGAVKTDVTGHLFRFYGGGFHDDGYLCDGDTLTGNKATSVGMVRNLINNSVFVGVKFSSTFTIFISDPNKYQTGSEGVSPIEMRTILYGSGVLGRRMYPLGFKGTITRIKIYLSQWGDGAGLQLSLFKDYSTFGVAGGNDKLNLLIDTDTGTPNSSNHKVYPAGTTEIDISDIALTDISSFYMNIRWTHTSTSTLAAIIRRMEIHISPSQ